jgi:nucleotide-binding universal stress UspA family protein
MKTYERILVALSLTEGREAAFERALSLARESGAELYLLHAVPDTRPFSHRAAERLRRSTALRRRAADAGVRAESFEQHGDPADTILLHAAARKADLIVMGAERPTGWWASRRSVAERVLRRTTRPVLVVRSDDVASADRGFERVLIAAGAPSAVPELVETARGLPARDSRRLTVLHAVAGLESLDAVHDRARWMVPEYRGYVLDDARRQFEGVLPGASRGTAAQLRVAAGPAAETIAAHGEELDADLIVMGRSGRLLHRGSTVAQMLGRTARALLIVPPAAMAGAGDVEQEAICA